MCILVVEDEDVIRSLVVEVIREAGYEVREASSGDAALAMLEGLDPPLSLLFTDIHMPGDVDGIVLAKHVRRTLPNIPIVFTTGRPDLLEAEAPFTRLHAAISKPYRLTDLIATAKLLLGNEHGPEFEAQQPSQPDPVRPISGGANLIGTP